MIMTAKRKITSGVAILCALMILIGIVPMELFGGNSEAEAALPSDYNSNYIYFDTTDTPWQGQSNLYIFLEGENGFRSGTATSDNNIFYWNLSQTTGYFGFSISKDWNAINANKSLRSDTYASIGDAKGKIFTIGNTQGSNGYNISQTEDSPDGTIIASTAEVPLNVSSTTKNGDGPSSENVAGGKVGQYEYTGKYLTFKSDFFDYLSDEEITAGRGNITDSNSEGYTDPYKELNTKISDSAVTYNETAGQITLNFINHPGNGTYNYVYVYDESNNSALAGAWPGQGFSGNSVTITGLSGHDKVRVILNSGQNSLNDKAHRYPLDKQGGIELDVGCTYTVDMQDTANPGFVNTTPVNKTNYTYPLYFGCFYKQFNSEKDGDNNSVYTSTVKNQLIPYKDQLVLNNFYWMSNIAKRDSSSTSVSGLVSSSSTGALCDCSSGEELPYFNQEWFDSNKVNGTSLAQSWTNVDFPFYQVKMTDQTDDSGQNPIYYQFNSRDTTSLYLDTSTGKIKEHTTAIRSQPTTTDANGTKGFFPFNDTASTDGEKNNLGFGTKFTIKFTLTEDGKIKGLPTTFEFMGDDDVWVYVDGNLALDMGGAHKDAYGKLDFSKREYTLASNVTISDSNKDNLTTGAGQSTGAFEIDGYDETTGKYDTSKVHTLTMYYMERGMFESDLFVRFNFTRSNSLTVENKVDVSNVNKGLQNRTLEAATYDIFDYSISNTDITWNSADDVSGNALTYESGTGASRLDSSTKQMGEDATYNGIQVGLDTDQKGTQTDKNFSQSPGPVSNTAFERFDDFFIGENMKGEHVTGLTDGSGDFGLLYGQSAVFKRQFYSESTMSVVQNNTLKKLQKPTNTGSTLEAKTAAGERKVEDYYKTSWTLIDVRDATLGASDGSVVSTDSGIAITDNQRDGGGTSDSTFLYKNKEVYDNEDYIVGTSLTATYTNVPNTGSLKITKKLADTNDKSQQEFTIKLKLTDVFGQEGVDLRKGDYVTGTKTASGSTTSQDVTYTADENGIIEIKLKANETVTITGIPIGTKYTISEDNTGNFRLDDIEVKSGDTVVANDPDAAEGTFVGTITETTTANIPTATVTNERQRRDLKLVKELKAEDGAVITDEDKAHEFTFNVTLSAKEFDITNYYGTGITEESPFNPSIAASSNTTFEVDSANKTIKCTCKVSENTPVTISNIPCGASYTVTEVADSDSTRYTYDTTEKTGTISATDTGNISTVTMTNTVKPTPKDTLKITKVDSGDQSIKLNGATFELYEVTSDSSAEGAILVEGEEGSSDAVYAVSVATATTAGEGENAGVATFTDLDPDKTYYIKETQSPGGYQSSGAYIKVEKNSSAELVANGYKISYNDSTHTYEATIGNTAIKLPEAGGTGTFNFVLFGVGAITLAGIAYILINKKSPIRGWISSKKEVR